MTKRTCRYIISLGCLFLLVAFCGSWIMDQIRRVDQGYCPENNWLQQRLGFVVPGQTAVIVDTSDRIPTEATKRFMVAIDSLTKNRDENSGARLPMLQKITIYLLPGSINDTPEKTESFCIPKRGIEANIFYEHPVYVEAQFRRFLDRLGKRLADLVDRDPSTQSPIVETMGDLVEHGDIESVILISDMLQNTSIWRDYPPRHRNDVLAGEACGRIRQHGLRRVMVYYIDRALPHMQSTRWPSQIWIRCLGNTKTLLLNDFM